MPKSFQTQTGLKLRRLHIENYKRLDSLTVEFPQPEMAGDLDVMVLGSQNGGGKTSVLECIGLFFLAALEPIHLLHGFPREENAIDLADVLIRSGKKRAEIIGVFEDKDDLFEIPLKITLSGEPRLHIESDFQSRLKKRILEKNPFPIEPEDALASLLAINSEPLLIPPLLHFNSYRKVQEGNPNLAAVAEPYSRKYRRSPYGRLSALSAFKGEILRSLLGKASLFEGLEEEESERTASTLNSLLKRYTGGTIEKLRPLPDNTFGFRIQGSNGQSFAFDGLSSGQKEIVSTLFLIWKYSKTNPSIVLIDEPELHLNAEWHADFIQQLKIIAPHNQYILATHSDQIFGSVETARRALLVPNRDKD